MRLGGEVQTGASPILRASAPPTIESPLRAIREQGDSEAAPVPTHQLSGP